MKIITNEKLIKRNATIGNGLFIAGLVITFGGVYYSFRSTTSQDRQVLNLALTGFILGFILVQVATYLLNRYGGNPRVDQRLATALKGLSSDYTIYHFMLPASHVLVGPAGIWILIPYRQRGVVKYEKNRWRIGEGGFLQAYMSLFGQEGIGRPDLEAEGEINAVKKLLGKTLSENEIPDVKAALIFTNNEVDIQADNTPLPALKVKGLKEFIRQTAKKKPLGQMQLAAIKSALPQ